MIIILISHGGTNRDQARPVCGSKSLSVLSARVHSNVYPYPHPSRLKIAAAIRLGANALQSVLSRGRMNYSSEHSRNDIAEAELCTKAEGELLAPATTRPQTPHLLHGLS